VIAILQGKDTKNPPYHQRYGGIFCDKLEKFIKLGEYFEKRSEKRSNFHEKVVILHRDSEKS